MSCMFIQLLAEIWMVGNYDRALIRYRISGTVGSVCEPKSIITIP